MPTAQKTRSSTPRLSEIARHVVAPPGAVSTGWPAVEAKCAQFGVQFDSWQDGAGRVILAKLPDGTYAASVGGVVISIPRQVGKTFLIGAIVFALCLLHPGLTVLWTAHRLRTANETFLKMQAFARRKKVAPQVRKIVLGAGDEAIVFHNGSRILFGARERGFGRGFDNVDVEVFDEAQILTENAIDDMLPAMNTAKNPLPIYIGTPPKPSDPSEVFTAKRTAALEGADPDTAYIEFSADRGCDPLDEDQWAKANPSFPLRTPGSAMLRMKKNLTSESFVREGLGVWDPTLSSTAIDATLWADLFDLDTSQPHPFALGVSMSADRKWTTIGLAGHRSDGLIHLELVKVGRGSAWVLDRLKAIEKKPIGVGVLTSGPAGFLLPDIKGGRGMTAIELAAACGRLLEDLGGGEGSGGEQGPPAEPKIRHSGSPVLNRAAAAVRLKTLSKGAVTWLEPDGVDCSPLEAVTLALGVLTDGKSKTRSGVVT